MILFLSERYDFSLSQHVLSFYFWILQRREIASRKLRNRSNRLNRKEFQIHAAWTGFCNELSLTSIVDFSVLYWSKIKSKPSFRKRKSSALQQQQNQGKRLRIGGATPVLQALAKICCSENEMLFFESDFIPALIYRYSFVEYLVEVNLKTVVVFRKNYYHSVQ